MYFKINIYLPFFYPLYPFAIHMIYESPLEMQIEIYFVIFPGTHCSIIPEPPDVTKLTFWPTPETEHLFVLAETSAYAPDLPVTIEVHEEFGATKDFILDALALDEVSPANLPGLTISDSNSVVVMSIRIDPNFSVMKVGSQFKTGVEEFEISLDVGEPFILFISHDWKKVEFAFNFNKEDLGKYTLPESFVENYKIKVEGDMSVNYVGFTNPGKMIFFVHISLILQINLFLGVSPAVLVGTQISLGCGDGWVFSHDWYQRPAIKLTCQASGLFDIPETGWPLCVDRKLSDFVYIYQQNCNFFLLFSNTYYNSMS